MGFNVVPLAQKARTQTLIIDSDLNLGNYDLITTDAKGDTAEFDEFVGGVGNFESGLISGELTVNDAVILNGVTLNGELVTTPPYQDLNFVAYTIPSTPNTAINYTSEYQVTEIAAVPNVINTLWGSYTNLVVPTISVTFTVKYNSANGNSGDTSILFNDVAVFTSTLAYNNNTATFTVDCNPTIKNVIKVLGRYLTVTPDITTFYLKRV